MPVEGPSRSCLTDHRPTLDQIKIHVPTTYGCVLEHMLLAEDDGAEDGSQNAERIALVGGPEHSYPATRMGFYVLGGQRGPYGVC